MPTTKPNSVRDNSLKPNQNTLGSGVSRHNNIGVPWKSRQFLITTPHGKIILPKKDIVESPEFFKSQQLTNHSDLMNLPTEIKLN